MITSLHLYVQDGTTIDTYIHTYTHTHTTHINTVTQHKCKHTSSTQYVHTLQDGTLWTYTHTHTYTHMHTCIHK